MSQFSKSNAIPRKIVTGFSPQLAKATGFIPYNMTNDYMFRAILQRNEKVLRGLICSCLHLAPEEIRSIVITNPIQLGEQIEAKDFILDINVTLNDLTHVNLEMQVENELNWTDRSLSYLCRSFDHLQMGQNYLEARSAIHIGFLNFTPFPECPEFYAAYKLMNIKNHHIYSDKFTLHVVDLNHIELATDEDKQYQIDYWASLFKARTWEDLRMIAQSNEFMKEAAETLCRLSADETIRQQCRAREDYYRTQNTYKKMIADRDAEIASKTAEIADKDAEIADKDAEIADKDAEIANLKARLAALSDKEQ